MQDNLAVRMSLEYLTIGKVLAQGNVVVDLAIDGQDELSVLAQKRLSSSV